MCESAACVCANVHDSFACPEPTRSSAAAPSAPLKKTLPDAPTVLQDSRRKCQESWKEEQGRWWRSFWEQRCSIGWLTSLESMKPLSWICLPGEWAAYLQDLTQNNFVEIWRVWAVMKSMKVDRLLYKSDWQPIKELTVLQSATASNQILFCLKSCSIIFQFFSIICHPACTYLKYRMSVEKPVCSSYYNPPSTPSASEQAAGTHRQNRYRWRYQI